MKNLFKYAAVHWKSLLAIIAVLFIQAYCDLSLPAYTSDIVNVGIQQGGIEDQVPEALSADEMEKLLLFVPEEDRETVLDAYETDSSTYDTEAYVLRESVSGDEEQMDALSDILAGPMMLTAGFESGSDMTEQIEAQLKENIPSQMVSDDMTVFDILKMMPEQQRDALIEEMEKQMGDLPDTILDQAAVSYVGSAYELEQAAVSYVGTAYEALGMDMDEIQIHYLLVTGGKMVALAFLGMAASVLVGFLASRVGAATGRDLRGNVFRKVVGFSNNEFDHFSTASLITRSTNDIQQIQLIIVMLLRIVLYAPILAIGGVIQVFQTNVSMSWIIGLAVLLIGLVILVLFLVAMPKFRILQTLVDKVNLVMREILTGLPVIRAFDEPVREPRHDLHDACHDADHERSVRADHVERRPRHRRGADAGRGYDGVHPVYDADHHGIPDVVHAVDHAAQGCCCSGPCGGSALQQDGHPRPGAAERILGYKERAARV